jgi:molybdate transport system substrate-binding protein
MVSRRSFMTGLTAAVAAGMPLPAMASDKVMVFAAASLKTALDEVSAAWKAGTGKETANAYAASSALARQIESGAPADIFISADLDWMTYLADRSLIATGTEVKLLGNQLVLVAPATSTTVLTIAPGFDLAGALNGGRLAVADVKAVPAGKYAKAALETLGAWQGVEHSLAQAENVRAALKLVSTGEAPAGIVYQTDAREDGKVKVLGTFPPGSHPPIIYPAVRLAASKNADAGAFLQFLQSKAAQEIFKAHGFTIPGG